MTERLLTGESLECICGHDLEYHQTLLQGVFCCIKCEEDGFHEFTARTIKEVSSPSERHNVCDECTQVFASKLRFEQHKLQHKWQEKWK
jgi:hypothetical protein